MQRVDPKAASQCYEKALEKDPDNERLKWNLQHSLTLAAKIECGEEIGDRLPRTCFHDVIEQFEPLMEDTRAECTPSNEDWQTFSEAVNALACSPMLLLFSQHGSREFDGAPRTVLKHGLIGMRKSVTTRARKTFQEPEQKRLWTALVKFEKKAAKKRTTNRALMN